MFCTLKWVLDISGISTLFCGISLDPQTSDIDETWSRCRLLQFFMIVPFYGIFISGSGSTVGSTFKFDPDFLRGKGTQGVE